MGVWRPVALLLAAGLLIPCAAIAGNPVFWPTGYASKEVYDHYASQGAGNVTCVGVGPVAREKGSQLFGEFACDIQTDTGGDVVLAAVPTSAIHWKVLYAGQASPVAGPLEGASAAGALHHVGLVGETAPAPNAIELDDQSIWKVVDPQKRLAHWRAGDVVSIQPDTGKRHLYRVVNKARGDSLEADFLGID